MKLKKVTILVLSYDRLMLDAFVTSTNLNWASLWCLSLCIKFIPHAFIIVHCLRFEDTKIKF